MTKDTSYTTMHSHCINPDTREMWIHGMYHGSPNEVEPGVEYMMANLAIKNLHYFRSVSDDPVVIHMHTCGGYWEQGMAIFDAIKAMPYWVTMFGYAEVRSMSSIIFQAADERVLMKHSAYVMHYGSFGIEADSKTAISCVEYEKKCNNIMLDIYEEHSNIPRQKIKRKLDAKGDWILTAAEAVDLGLCDAVVEDFS